MRNPRTIEEQAAALQVEIDRTGTVDVVAFDPASFDIDLVRAEDWFAAVVAARKQLAVVELARLTHAGRMAGFA